MSSENEQLQDTGTPLTGFNMDFLKSLINKDTPDSTKNAMALFACLMLSIGFMGTVFRADKAAELTVLCGALVSIAVFHKD